MIQKPKDTDKVDHVFMMMVLEQLLKNTHSERWNSGKPQKKIHEIAFAKRERGPSVLNPSQTMRMQLWLDGYGAEFGKFFPLSLHEFRDKRSFITDERKLTLFYPIGMCDEPTLSDPEGTVFFGQKNMDIMAGMTLIAGQQKTPVKKVIFRPKEKMMLLVIAAWKAEKEH